MTTAPAKFSTKPTVVEAIQFTGWSRAVDIFDWVNTAFYVPAGYEHPFRRPDERDPSNGGIYDDRAKEFLLIKTPQGMVRVDPGDWVFRHETGTVTAVKNVEFQATFVRVSEP